MEKDSIKDGIIAATKLLVVLCIISIAIEFFFGNNFTIQDVKDWVVMNSCFTYIFYFGNGLFTDYLERKIPWSEQTRKRLVIGLPLIFLFNLVLTFIAVTIVAVYVYGGEWGYVFTPQGKNNVLITLVIVTIISLVFHSIGFFQEGQQQKVVNERLRKEKAQAELNALKTQVDPHFLFNSFNVLSGLIDENPSQAQKFLGGLSKIYRYILEHRDEGLVTLEEELAFAQQYLTLQRIRFEEGIKLSLDVDDSDLLKKLPALSLQLLLENAIKHNGFNADEPLKILIETSSDTLKVSNNKQARIKLSEGSGLGLKNIAKRYALHKVNGFAIDDTTDTFTVQIPLIV